MDFSKVILMTDLDGTLLTDDKRILPLDLEAIERFRAGGGLFTMATGRGYSMAKHIADKLGRRACQRHRHDRGRQSAVRAGSANC